MTDGSIEEATAMSEVAADDSATEQAPPAAAKRPMKPSTKRALIIIGIVAALLIAAMIWIYLIEGSKYVSTDNAQIDGEQISINAPASGTLVEWRATQGTDVTKDHVVGRIRLSGGFVQPQQPIRAPGDGTIAVDNGVEGAFVAAGTPLATAYDLSRIYVTARVDETDINDVRLGQKVDIEVDAFSGAELEGTVREVQGGAAGVFSAFPQSNTAGNYQKVTQVIPVKIAIDDTEGLALVPGMNVSVKIHKDD